VSEALPETEISVVVPAYNEEESVRPLYEQLLPVLDGMQRKFEIIFVDDGSSDGTFPVLEQIAAGDGRVKVIRLRANFGQTAALDAAIKHSRGDVVIAMDADLQNDPADIPRLVARLDEGYDCVSGWRRTRRDPLLKRFISRGANVLRKIFIRDRIHDSGCTLKAYRREAFEGVDLYGEMHRFIPALLQWRGYHITELEVAHHPRRFGKTKYSMVRVVKGLLDMMVVSFWMRFSARPMHLFGALGILMGLVGFGLATYLAVLKLAYGEELASRPMLTLAVLLIILGVQFTIFGVLADIMVKIFYSRDRIRPYTIARRLNLGPGAAAPRAPVSPSVEAEDVPTDPDGKTPFPSVFAGARLPSPDGGKPPPPGSKQGG
jgi:glycosyltransferase involved in cell wall biosynthesis